MFYYLEGTVAVLEAGVAVLDVGGIGFKCYTTANSQSYLEIGKRVRLYTYCNIKEDAFDLYGFHEMSEKRSFEMLLGVSGVGPKAALSILSAVTPEDMAMAVITDNEKAFTAAPGIGRRIAQRIILELKDKVAKENAAVQPAGIVRPGGAGMPGAKLADATSALAVLGYSQSEITAALRTIDVESLTVEEIIRKVLKASVK